MEQRPGNSKSNSNYDQAENLENLLKHAAAAEDGEKKEQQMSQATKNKVEAAKAFLERKYSKLKQEEQEKKENWELLEKTMGDMNLSASEKENIKRDIMHKETERLRLRRKKLSPKDFEPVAIIGRGAFGEVWVCRWKETNEIVAMKKMNKSEMEYKNQISHVRAERDILASAANHWIVELKCSFQDEKFLYLVMEYLPGGDLMTLLMKKDILAEEEAKFYMAQAILAVESVHTLNYIHRDLKPDNVLLDRRGHIKLSDFGLCKNVEMNSKKFESKKDEAPQYFNRFDTSNLTKKPVYKRNRQLLFSTVGTPDYIAPEVFGQNGYTETVDWWSLGVILFEMLVGYPPFFSEDPSLTCQKILHWKKTFAIPAEAQLSDEAVDLLQRLICDASERLGTNGVEEIKAHPFFAGIDWKKMREMKAPNIPDLKNEIDTSNFDHFEEEEPWYVEDNKSHKNRANGNFIGYTFKRNAENERSSLIDALQSLEAQRMSQQRPGQHGQKSSQGKNSNSMSNGNYLHNLSQASASNISSALGSISAMDSNPQVNTNMSTNSNASTTSTAPTNKGLSSYTTAQQKNIYSNIASHAHSGEAYFSTNLPKSPKNPSAGSKAHVFKGLDEKAEVGHSAIDKKRVSTPSTGLHHDSEAVLKKTRPTTQATRVLTGSHGGLPVGKLTGPTLTKGTQDTKLVTGAAKPGANKYGLVNLGPNKVGGLYKSSRDMGS